MIIVIDVGGTFTDAVLLERDSGKLLNTVKVRTLNNNILASFPYVTTATNWILKQLLKPNIFGGK
jgi:N-methylhydantoinase A/oxoprolinase/acetone carboxylase beta subunit